MRRIKIQTWKEMNEKGEERESNTLNALSMCLNIGLQEEKLAGWDKARMINRLDRAFRKADKDKTLELEEVDYVFMKKIVSKHMPAGWGGIPEIMKAIEDFMNTEEKE